MKKWWIILSILALVLLAGYWFVAVPAVPTPDGSESRARFTPGPYRVLSESFELVDPSRPTQAYNDFEGSPSRLLRTEIWRPEGLQQPGPLVVYSHGFLSFRQDGLYLIRFLASHGYTVIAADYPLTGFYAPDGPLITDVVNQPGDISFLLDTVLARNAAAGDPLQRTIDPDRIAVVGVSLGGLTSLLAGFHHQLRDPRIDAVVSIAGPSSMFTPVFFAGSHLPLLLVYGDSDVMVPPDANGEPVLAMYPDSVLVMLRNASHAGFAQPSSTLMRFIDNPDTVGCESVLERVGGKLEVDASDLVEVMGGPQDGIDLGGELKFCSSTPIPVAMQAARQHMFTTLAVAAFLDSLFARDSESRQSARHYLLDTLAAENGGELRVELPAPQAVAGQAR